jgi:hypothetical protein
MRSLLLPTACARVRRNLFGAGPTNKRAASHQRAWAAEDSETAWTHTLNLRAIVNRHLELGNIASEA